ncbi:RNase H domain-containing protein [Trichonephila clavipes]|nr:RNase H domain-containing protein [Trichonephila clavipes]
MAFQFTVAPLLMGLWNLITCLNVLTQWMILTGSSSIHTELPVHVNKQADLPAYLKQLALERHGGIPIDAVQVYTGGSRDDYYRSGSGIYIKSQDHILKIHRRNPDGCSVFRSELIAIDETLGSLASLPTGKEIWILSDSRSAIQHLSNWQSVRDNVGVSILTKLKRLSTSHKIYLQWIPSPIDLEGNEIADTLAKNKTAWITPPEHHWYQCSRPGGSLAHGFTRPDQTLLARFRSGHIETTKFFEGCKSFEMCTNCSSEPATPAHILECLGLTNQDLADDPLLVLDFLKVYDVMDLV